MIVGTKTLKTILRRVNSLKVESSIFQTATKYLKNSISEVKSLISKLITAKSSPKKQTATTTTSTAPLFDGIFQVDSFKALSSSMTSQPLETVSSSISSEFLEQASLLVTQEFALLQKIITSNTSSRPEYTFSKSNQKILVYFFNSYVFRSITSEHSPQNSRAILSALLDLISPKLESLSAST